MTASDSGSIVPITLTVNGRVGLTLWAPPWEDEDGEEWQGFLGEGSTILLFPSAEALSDYIAEVTDEDRETDLSDHPSWEAVTEWSVAQFRPGPDDSYDLDAVFSWATEEPDPVTVSSIGSVVEMVAEIAECCDDGALKALVNGTPAYVDVQDEDMSYSGREGQKAWDELGDEVASTWERAIARVDRWLEWRGDFSATDLGTETAWDRIGAEPVQLVLPERTVLTVRGARDDEVLFLGSDATIAVFATVEGLARYCREADEHALTRLEFWDEIRDEKTVPDERFRPALTASYDLTAPTVRGGRLLLEMMDFCELEADEDELTDPSDDDAWAEAVAELDSCLQQED